MKDATAWLERYRQFWEQSFDRLEDYLRELKAQEKAQPKPAARRRSPAARPRKSR
jgi:hypothetical protein